MRTAVQYALQPPPIGTAGALYRPHLVHRLDKALVWLFRLPLLSISHGFFFLNTPDFLPTPCHHIMLVTKRTKELYLPPPPDASSSHI